jgi:uncharacterized membrane protein (TIGR02234 family)
VTTAGEIDPRRRLYGPTLLLGLLGAVGVAVGASRPWAAATSTQPGLPAIHASASGTDLAPIAGALGWALLAGFGAVIATRGRLRRALGAAILLASVVVLVAVLVPGGSTDVLRSGLSARGWSGGGYTRSTEPWRWLVLASALATAIAGAATAWYGNRWAVMGSRYDAPDEARPVEVSPAEELTETQVWRAIDQGRDPTHEP